MSAAESTEERAAESAVAEPGAPTSCANCGDARVVAFCPVCGQRRLRGRLSLGDWLVETFQSLTNLEGRLPRTLRGLVTGPGRVAREWVEGHRVRYTNPFRLALVGSALWFLAQAVFHGEEQAWIVEYGQWVNLLLLPPLALIVHAAFARTGFVYVEHLALLSFVSGFAFLWRSVLVVLGEVGVPGLALNLGDQLAFVGLLCAAFVQFHRDRCGTAGLWLRTIAALVGLVVASGVGVAFVQALAPA